MLALVSLTLVLATAAPDPRTSTVIVQQELAPGWPVQTGAGVIVAASGDTVQILTAAHLFRDQKGQVRTITGVVGFYGKTGGIGETSDIIQIMFSTTADLAVVSVVAPRSPYTVARLAETLPDVGDALVVVGHPQGKQLFVESPAAVISRNVVTYDFAFRCDTCAPGDSGGGVFNSDGALVGIEVGASNITDRKGHVVIANAGYSQPVESIEAFLAPRFAF